MLTPEQNRALQKYLAAFRKVRRARGGHLEGPAPHKPILLISVIDFALSVERFDGLIPLDGQIFALFIENWRKYVKTGHDPQIALPFFYLKNDKPTFWHLIPRPDAQAGALNTIRKLQSFTNGAKLSEDLTDLLKQRDTALLLRAVLVDTYFKGSRNQQTDMSERLERLLVSEAAIDYKILPQDEQVFLRSDVFKRELPKVYNYTCCISGLGFKSPEAQLVDACHIVPFAESQDDSAANGVVLEPTLHRAFDRGLIAIDDDYRVRISSLLDSMVYPVARIKEYQGKRIRLPQDEKYWPSPENLLKKMKSKFID
jgi:putative restriction endonuclease